MKNRVFILSFLILMTMVNFVFAQTNTKKLSYQAVVRNAANELVVNQNLSVEITILNADNAPQYKETHASVPTNQNGLLWLWIGEGTPSLGTMDDVVWKDATIKSVFTLPDGNSVTQNTPVTAMPYAYYADEVDTIFLQDYLTTHDYGNDDYVTRLQLKDTLKNYLTIDGLCDSIKKCEVIANLQNADSLLGARITLDSTALSGKIHSDSTYLKGLIDSTTVTVTNNTSNITNNTTNISNITNNITNLQVADSVLNARFTKDSIALSKRLDTMFTHMCDSIEQCEVIANLRNADAALSARITHDSILSYRADSILAARITADSILSYKTDSTLSARITRDSILSYKADSVLSARITADSTNLDNNYYNKIKINDTIGYILNQITSTSGNLDDNYYTKTEINDTLGHYTTSDEIDSLLGNYAKSDTLKNYLTIDGLCDSIKKCEVITGLQSTDSVLAARITRDSILSYKADSVLSARIISDSVLFYKTDSVLLAHILTDSALSYQADSALLARIMKDSVVSFRTDSVLLARILNDSALSYKADSALLALILKDSANLANNYYTYEKINDTLSHYTTTDHIDSLLRSYATNDTLKNYLTIDGLCDSIKKCDVITNLQNADAALSARITQDSILSYKADSILAARITRDSILSHKADSILADSITTKTVSITNNLTNITENITNNTTNITNLFNADSALAVRVHNDSLALSKRMDTLLTHLCDSIEKCDIISNLRKSDSLLGARITRDSVLFYKADSVLASRITRDSILSYKADSVLSARLVDTASKFRLALKDSLSRYLDSAQVRKAIHDSIGNGTLTIAIIDSSTTIFKANDKNNKTVTLAKVAGTGSYNDLSDKPTPPTVNDYAVTVNLNGSSAGSFTLNQSTDAVVNLDSVAVTKKGTTNTYKNTNDFTGGTITVPSNGTAIPRPANSDPNSCNNNNAVAVCDLLAVFDSLSNRIKKLEDELAAINQPTPSAVSISLSEITRTSIKATATVSDPNLDITSYKFCISENSSMSNPVSCETVTSNEYTFTGLTPNTVYYATVKVFHSSGNDSSEVASAKTLPLTLAISFTPVSPVCLCEGNPTTVTYTANIEDANLDDYSFSWSVPDGGPEPNNATERTCTITYSAPNSYTVNCTATLKTNSAVQLTADTTITTQNCTTPTITTCETDLTVTVKSVTGNPDFINWKDGTTGTSVSAGYSNPTTHTYVNPGVYTIEVSKDGCSYEHKEAMGEVALYPCSVSAAHTNTTEYTGSSTTPGTGGLETETTAGSNQITHVADQDGNTYPVVQIGSQCWMAKNLRTTHFSDSTGMTFLPLEGSQYGDSLHKAYRYAPALGMDYLSSWGYYYNWRAAMYGNTSQGICPKGWHVPSKTEWETMATVVNGSEVVFPYSDVAIRLGTLAGKLSSGCTWKERYTEINSYPENIGQEGSPGDYNNPERNASGFSSIPTGWVSASTPNWYNDNTYAYYWSSTLKPNSTDSAYALFWNHNYYDINCVPLPTINTNNTTGLTVRCLRDETALTSYPTLSVTPSTTGLLLCPGTPESVTYTAEVTVNGLTTHEGYSYTWQVTNTKTNTTETLSNQSYQVTIQYSDSANYKVSCVAKSNTIEDSAKNSVMTLVRVKVAPSFTASVSGFTVTLNDLVYVSKVQWTSGGEVVNLPNPPTHTYGSAGIYQITAFTGANCPYNQEVEIEASVVLSASNNTAICPDSNSKVTYTATVDGATATGYSWAVTSDNPGGFTPTEGTGNPFMVTYTTTGTYTITCTANLDGGGSLVKETTTTITAHEAPVFNTCVDGKWLTMSDMSNVATVHWTSSDAGESVAANVILKSHKYGDNESTYSIKVVSSDGCKATRSGDLGAPPSTNCRVTTVGQSNEVYDGDKLLRVKDTATNETNWYSVVQIGSQCWMAENLRVYVYDKCADFRNNSEYRPKFGRLYKRDGANACPTGWHLPSLAEWEQMESEVAGSTISHSSTNNYVGTHAGLLAGVCDWTNSDVTSSPGHNAQNTCGFRVLPAGNRVLSSGHVDYLLGEYASFWCSDEGSVAWTMKFNEAGTMKESITASSYYISVRCVRDEAAVVPTPTLSVAPDNDGDILFCPGASQAVTYTASLTLDNEPITSSGYSYVWSVTSTDADGFTDIVGQSTGSTPSINITYTIPGHYTVSCTATSTTTSCSTDVNTNVDYKDAPSFIVSETDLEVTLNGLPDANTTITWTENGTPEGLASNPHTYPEAGTYKITVTNTETGCSTSADVTVTASGGGDPFVCGTSTVTDIEGNVYNTVQIGTGENAQCWMKENLRVKLYSDGQAHNLTNSQNTLSNNDRYYYYPNLTMTNEDSVHKYGLLYNWYAAMDGSTNEKAQGICPTGWHLPSKSDFVYMHTVVHGEPVNYNTSGFGGGDAAKFTTGYWNASGEGDDAKPGNTSYSHINESGFSALPAGLITVISNNANYNFHNWASFWSSTQVYVTDNTDNKRVYELTLYYSNINVKIWQCFRRHAASVRCVRD